MANQNPPPSSSSTRQPHSNRATVPNRTENEQIQDEAPDIKYSAAHVIQLFVPVSICMIVVIASMQAIGYFMRSDGVYLLYTPFTKPTDDAGERFIMSIGNALIVLSVVVVMTVALILLYKFRFYRVIHGWLVLSSVMLLYIIAAVYLEELFKNYNVAVDVITFCFIVWNFAAMGIMCVHWKGPHRMQQAYLVMMSSLMALIFIKHLPDWTVWTVLATLAIWDLVAVLCPKGPLRILVETAQERNEPIFPALIYSATMIYEYVLMTELGTGESTEADTPVNLEQPAATSAESTTSSAIQPLTAPGKRIAPLRGKRQNNDVPNVAADNVDRQPALQPSEREYVPLQPPDEDRGVKLGLGDFIFYSVLVGKASSYGDWNITIACYVSILVGLSFILMLLALFRKALPALPISIFLGLVFYFATFLAITPFVTEVSIRQYLI